MSEMTDISGPRFGPVSGGAPKQIVLLLHGWGADGNDLIGLAPIWADILPDALFVSPHAPFPCDVGVGRQWFSLDDRRPAAMLSGVHAARPYIDRFIEHILAENDLGADRLALVGFSQGTMMSLHVAPRRPQPFACVVGYSGALLDGETLAKETKSRSPVLLVHGQADPIVAASALDHASSGLQAAGFAVEAHLRPGLGHGIDEVGLALGGRFLTVNFELEQPAET